MVPAIVIVKGCRIQLEIIAQEAVFGSYLERSQLFGIKDVQHKGWTDRRRAYDSANTAIPGPKAGRNQSVEHVTVGNVVFDARLVIEVLVLDREIGHRQARPRRQARLAGSGTAHCDGRRKVTLKDRAAQRVWILVRGLAEDDFGIVVASAHGQAQTRSHRIRNISENADISRILLIRSQGLVRSASIGMNAHD